MRILQVCPRYYPDIGGVEEHIKNIGERLAKKHDVVVYTTTDKKELVGEGRINNIIVKRFSRIRLTRPFSFSPTMFKQFKKASFDIVHGHNYHDFPLLFSSYCPTKKFIITPHYHGFGSTFISNLGLKFYKVIGRKTLIKADKIVCVSNFEMNLIIRDFKIDEEKFTVIPSGIDHREFRDSSKSHRNKQGETILYVGRLERYKGVEYLLKVLPKVRKGIHLEIVGEGSLKSHLSSFVQSRGLKDRVKFFSGLSRREILERFRNADLFVSLSKYEAFGMTIAEALASRVPCIVTRGSALENWVDERNCFAIQRPPNLNELSSLIQEVIGRKVSNIKIPDWDEVVEKLLEIYSSK